MILEGDGCRGHGARVVAAGAELLEAADLGHQHLETGAGEGVRQGDQAGIVLAAGGEARHEDEPGGRLRRVHLFGKGIKVGPNLPAVERESKRPARGHRCDGRPVPRLACGGDVLQQRCRLLQPPRRTGPENQRRQGAQCHNSQDRPDMIGPAMNGPGGHRNPNP